MSSLEQIRSRNIQKIIFCAAVSELLHYWQKRLRKRNKLEDFGGVVYFAIGDCIVSTIPLTLN